MVPPGVTRDARQALTAYPQIVMLPARFAVAENTGKRWPLVSGAVASPREARMTLATYFTAMVPAMLQPPPQERAAYQDAARLLERERRSQLTVAGRRFRIIRVETAVAPGRTARNHHAPPTTTPTRPWPGKPPNCAPGTLPTTKQAAIGRNAGPSLGNHPALLRLPYKRGFTGRARLRPPKSQGQGSSWVCRAALIIV